MRSSASSFSFQYPLFSFRSSSSCLRPPPHLPITVILPFIFPSIMCFRTQFLCKMWPIQLAFLLFIVCRIFLFRVILHNTSFHTQSVHPIFSILLQHHISKLFRYFWSTFQRVQVSAPYKAVLQMQHSMFIPKYKFNLLVKRAFFKSSLIIFRKIGPKWNFKCSFLYICSMQNTCKPKHIHNKQHKIWNSLHQSQNLLTNLIPLTFIENKTESN